MNQRIIKKSLIFKERIRTIKKIILLKCDPVFEYNTESVLKWKLNEWNSIYHKPFRYSLGFSLLEMTKWAKELYIDKKIKLSFSKQLLLHYLELLNLSGYLYSEIRMTRTGSSKRLFYLNVSMNKLNKRGFSYNRIKNKKVLNKKKIIKDTDMVNLPLKSLLVFLMIAREGTISYTDSLVNNHFDLIIFYSLYEPLGSEKFLSKNSFRNIVNILSKKKLIETSIDINDVRKKNYKISNFGIETIINDRLTYSIAF